MLSFFGECNKKLHWTPASQEVNNIATAQCIIVTSSNNKVPSTIQAKKLVFTNFLLIYFIYLMTSP